MAKVLDRNVRIDRRRNTKVATSVRHERHICRDGALTPERRAHAASLPSFFGDPFKPAAAAMSDRLVRKEVKSKARAKFSFLCFSMSCKISADGHLCHCFILVQVN
jgi:hypothetical protein